MQAPINVALHTDKGDILQTRANNLSRGGLCVEIELTWELQENKLVIVEFMEEWLFAKIPALVVQAGGTSASLMFIEHSPELHDFLSSRRR